MSKVAIILVSIFMAHFSQRMAGQDLTVNLVYPYLDAVHSRWFFFSSACHPFGMVSLFPDNKTDGEWESGYRYGVDTIRDFSHIHEWQLSGVAVMPVSYAPKMEGSVFNNYASPFSHKEETVYPGYHSVKLSRYNIKAELTATNRVGMHRYSFSRKKKHGIIFQLGGHLGPSDIPRGGYTLVNDHEIRGFMVNAPTMRRPKDTYVYFCARFNKPFKTVTLNQNNKQLKNARSWQGSNGTLLLEFPSKDSLTLMMKVGVSFVDENGAAKNIDLENPGWDFEQIRNEARDHWNSMLSRIKVEGGTEIQQRRFYTDLWHAIQGRRMISDGDGRYTDNTGSKPLIRQIPFEEKGKPKFNMYNSDAFWGAQWTLNTLWQLVYPEIAEDFCNSFLEYYKNGGLIPRGPSGGNYTFVMTGASSTPFFVSAWQKGIRGFDINLAYEGLKKNHMPGGMMSKVGYEHKSWRGGGLENYIQNGYVPYPLSDTIFGMHQDGAAITLENAYQDWCLAQLAKSLGKTEDYEYFTKRSTNYRNLFNSEEGYMVPKDKNGTWKTPYDPLLYDNGFEEANGAQYSWFVPHDMDGLIQLREGSDSVISRLNREFELSQPYRFCNEHPELLDNAQSKSNASKFINDKRTWINYSNQPNSETVFIFNHAGAPWLTQYWSRMVVDSAYSKLSPYFGYNGDEDQGLMGSLSVLMKIGLFQMTGGCEPDPVYELGSPIFDKVTINLNPNYYKASQFIMEAVNNSENNKYIQSTTLSGNPVNTYFIRHSDINRGSTLVLKMGDSPSKTCGITGIRH